MSSTIAAYDLLTFRATADLFGTVFGTIYASSENGAVVPGINL